MDATITNTTTDPVFIPGPQMSLAPTGDPDGNDVQTWPDITVADLDSNVRLKELVLAGTVTISVVPDTFDAAAASTGTVNNAGLPSYTVAELAAIVTGYNGRMAYASNGRAGAEGAGLGTGTPVCYTNGQWRRLEDLAIVAA